MGLPGVQPSFTLAITRTVTILDYLSREAKHASVGSQLEGCTEEFRNIEGPGCSSVSKIFRVVSEVA